MDYNDYLSSPEWGRRRLAALGAARWRCEACGAKKGDATLDVHHLTYERLGHEPTSDLMVLCRACHDLHHLPDPPLSYDVLKLLHFRLGDAGFDAECSCGFQGVVFPSKGGDAPALYMQCPECFTPIYEVHKHLSTQLLGEAAAGCICVFPVEKADLQAMSIRRYGPLREGDITVRLER